VFRRERVELPPTWSTFIDSISRDKTTRLRGEIYTRISRDSEHDARMLPRRGTEIYIRIRAVLSFSLHILAAGTCACITSIAVLLKPRSFGINS
jgi:hypothetical protein